MFRHAKQAPRTVIGSACSGSRNDLNGIWLTFANVFVLYSLTVKQFSRNMTVVIFQSSLAYIGPNLAVWDLSCEQNSKGNAEASISGPPKMHCFLYHINPKKFYKNPSTTF